MNEAIELIRNLWPIGVIMIAILATLIVTREKSTTKTKNKN